MKKEDVTSSVPTRELGYSQAADELDSIVRSLDAGAVDVDVLSIKFQRAIELIEEMDRRIRLTRDQVNSLAPRLDRLGTVTVEEGDDRSLDDRSPDEPNDQAEG